MSLRRATLPFVLGAALAAAQDAAPLAESKQQLQALKKDQAAQKAKAEEGLRLGAALPSLAIPANEPAAPAPRPRDQQEGSTGPVRNWLVDGYDRLDRAGGAEEADEVPLDPRDPDYFLRVYERQRAAGEVRRGREREARDGAAAGTAAATMDPFLRNWLAGSPVEGVLRETRGGRRSGEAAGFDLSGPRDGASARFDDPAAGNAVRDAGPGARLDGPVATVGTPPAANPYLAALGLDRGASGGPAAPVLTPPPPTPAPAAAWTPPPPPKAETRRLPVRPADEAKKYFPQLRKF